MRRLLRWIGPVLATLILGAVAVASPSVAYAAEADASTPTISVTGQGTVVVPYDTAQIHVGVSALENSPLKAFQQMAANMNKVVEALRAAGVKDEDLKTGTLTLSPEYDWTQEGQKLRGYRATNMLIVTTRQLDQVAALVQAAVDAGANQLHGITFLVKDTAKAMAQAMDLAIDDAKAKAERAAARLGMTVGRPVQVHVSDGGYVPIPRAVLDVAAGKGGETVPVFQGTEEFTVTVNITFELR